MLDPAPRAPARIGRRRRAAAVVLAACGVLYVAALAILSSAPVERRLHERVHAVLRARLGDVRLDEEVELDPLFRLTFGPLEIPAPSGGPPLVRAEHVAARPSLTALLRGRFEPATVLLGDVRVRPGPGGRDLRALLERLRRPRAFAASGGEDAGAGGELPKLKLRGLVVIAPLRGELVEVGPIDADVRLARGDAPRLDARVSLRGAGRITLHAARVAGTWRASLHAEELGPGSLPPALRSHAAAITGGAVTLDVDAEAPADLSRATATVRAELDGLVVAGDRIAAEPVGPLHASASGHLAWDRAARRVALTAASATFLHTVTVSATGEAHLGHPETFSAALRAERVDWVAVLSALPAALALPPQAPRPAGLVNGHLELSGPLLAPDEWTVSAALDLAPLREAARRAGRSPLAEPFVHRPPLDGGGRGPELRVGPANPDFVPIAELPEHVVRAVTTSEDAGFFGHAGFDFDELKNAIAQGARRGRLVRGGSTISQQLAKNLFLDGERTFARKVREAAVTVGLEATLPKRRLLEIYLNVAEWGPGLWGIGPAARHWFGKDARALTPKEAALLASVIPSPVRYHEQLFARGALDDVWEARVDDLLFTMNMQGALPDDQLAAATSQRLSFPPVTTAAAETAAPVPGEAPQAAPAPAER